MPDKTVLDSAFQYFRRMFDSDHGGFGDAPKFPAPGGVSISCCATTSRTGSQEALDMVLDTLRAMANGGMHDQLGGGFHRYSVDERWFVPHFEKMLYDQAQLADFLPGGVPDHARSVLRGHRAQQLDYVLRDMTHPEGGFYSAEDADSVIDPAQSARERRGRVLHLDRRRRSQDALGTVRSRRSPTVTASKPMATSMTIRTASSPARTSCTCDEIAGSAASPSSSKSAPEQSRSELAHPIEARPPASGRQDPHRLERPDDFRLRQGRADIG